MVGTGLLVGLLVGLTVAVTLKVGVTVKVLVTLGTTPPPATGTTKGAAWAIKP